MAEKSRERLTPKQEKFAQKYVELGSASAAYRSAYDAENMNKNTIHQRAHDLMNNGKVTVRIGELLDAAQERHDITVDGISAQLQQDRKYALMFGQASAAVSASMGLARLHGLIIEKKEDVTPRRSLEQIDKRITELLERGRESGTPGSDRGERPGDPGDEALPTVPDVGTA